MGKGSSLINNIILSFRVKTLRKWKKNALKKVLQNVIYIRHYIRTSILRQYVWPYYQITDKFVSQSLDTAINHGRTCVWDVYWIPNHTVSFAELLT